MLAGRVWRDDSFDAAFCQPIAQAPRVVSTIGQQAVGQADRRQEFIGGSQIMAVAGGEQE